MIDNVVVEYVITIFFATLIMFVVDICILIIDITVTFLFGPQTYIIPLEIIAFIGSAIIGILYIFMPCYISDW
jgi:hypothetical protein